MAYSDQLLRAIELLYGSILDEQDFRRAIAAIAELTGASGAAYLQYDMRSGVVLDTLTHRVDPDTEAQYRAHFSAQDIRVPPALGKPIGEIFTEQSLLERKFFEASSIYDFLWRNDIPHIMAALTSKTPVKMGTISLQRSRTLGCFSEADRARMTPLMPHLVRALSVRGLLDAARQTQRAYLDVLHRLPFGTIFLNGACHVTEISSVAEDLLKRSDGICYSDRRIIAIHPDDDRRLQNLVQATVYAVSNKTIPGGTVIVRRPNARLSLSIAVVPVRSPHLFTARIPACTLVIFDPHSSPLAGIATVKAALQLSDAEAALACQLFKGISLREAADNLQLSINTCKTQLKSIYEKTGCRSHVDLAKALFMVGMTQRL